MQFFCFLLKQFFENVKKKVYGRGVLERVGRVTVNTTFFLLFFLPNRGAVLKRLQSILDYDNQY